MATHISADMARNLCNSVRSILPRTLKGMGDITVENLYEEDGKVWVGATLKATIVPDCMMLTMTSSVHGVILLLNFKTTARQTGWMSEQRTLLSDQILDTDPVPTVLWTISELVNPILQLIWERVSDPVDYAVQTLQDAAAYAPLFRTRIDLPSVVKDVSAPGRWRFCADRDQRWCGSVPPRDRQQVYAINFQCTHAELAEMRLDPTYDGGQSGNDYYEVLGLGPIMFTGRGSLAVPETTTGRVSGSYFILPRSPEVDMAMQLAVNALALLDQEKVGRRAVESAFQAILQPLVDQALARS